MRPGHGLTVLQSYPTPSPGPDIGERLLGSGRSDGYAWKLWAHRASNAVSERDEVTGPTGSSGGTEAWELPLDVSDSYGGIRFVDGDVALNASTVRVEANGGQSWTLKPFGAEAGFGRAFFALTLTNRLTSLKDVVALDAHGHEIARKQVDQSAEQMLLTHEHTPSPSG